MGTFEKGQQRDSKVAADANGNYVVVWTSPTQDDSGEGVYARRYTSAGVAIGNEFLINQTTTGNQFSPSIAMNASGRFVVVWTGNGTGDTDGVFARVYDPNGVAITDELLVHREVAGNQFGPDVGIEANGDFVVTWAGQGNDDADGVALRRFTADGQPIGEVDEIQRLRFLGPPSNGSLFTLIHDGVETGTIVFTTNANQLANRIRDALRALGNTGDQIQVFAQPNRNEVQLLSLTDSPVMVNELQTLRFTGNPTSGDVTLDFGGTPVGPIVFAGAGMGATTAANIEAALIASGAAAAGDVLVSQVAGSDFDFTVEFTGGAGWYRCGSTDRDPEQSGSRRPKYPANRPGHLGRQLRAVVRRQLDGADRSRWSRHGGKHPGGA